MGYCKFPPVERANPEGLLASGGDLSIDCLRTAYEQGIFPWYDVPGPILWWAPDPRMVLFPDEVKVSKSMRLLMRKNKYTVTENTAFDRVIRQCARVPRSDQDGTWIHGEMIEAYENLHREGYAFSVEVWNERKELVGGLYGVQVHPLVLSGESMFHLESNTSKIAFIHLANRAKESGVKVIDCQLYTAHLESLGARLIPREVFMSYLGD